ncbi:MAG: glycosyltransferase family 2 protein [Promethearchaeota archaeon]
MADGGEMIPLTISIATANNKKLILGCLRSIYETTNDLKFEIYVVINNSLDDSGKAIKENFPEVKLIKNRKMLGFTHNHNMVIQRAQGKYILVLNDDTIILDGALKKMVDFMEVSPDVGILGCKILNPDGSLQWSCGKSITQKIEFFWAGMIRALMPFLPKQHFTQTQEVCWVTGACLLARAEAIREVGLFDENIIIYYEDGDWCYRMVQAGWKVVFYPHAEIIHYVGKTREKNLLRDLNIIYQSRYYFFRKHYGVHTNILVRLLTVIELIFRYLRCLVVYAFKHQQRQRTKERLRGYWIILWLALGVQVENTQ